MPTLTIQLPGHPPVSHVLKDETITIGRMKGNTIVIEDSSISLMHAKITRKDGQYYLKDLNSTNGTIVNGQAIGEARLRDQDKVRFAEIATHFLAEGDVLPAPVPVPTTGTALPAAPPLALDSRREANAAVFPSVSQTQITQKPAPSVTSPRQKKKFNRPVLLVAAAITLVVLPGAGFVVWKSVNADVKETQAVQSVVSSKAKNSAAQPGTTATQISPAKKPVEAAPALEPVDAASAVSANVRELVASLKSNDVGERRQAASGLHGLGMEAKDAIPALKGALNDSDSEVQMWAALALVNTQTYDKAVIPILIQALKKDNAVLRQVACLSLGLIPYEPGDKTAVLPALTEAAGKDASEDVRQAAKSALNIIGAETGGSGGPESAAK